MDNTEYTKIYSILGVFQDDGWEMIRSAYKKQINRWHPDRFQDPNHRKIAEEKSKEINYAYQKLAEYYEKFGELPPDHHHAEVSSTLGTSEPNASMHEEDPVTDPHIHPAASIPAARKRSYVPIILGGVLIALVYSIWEPTNTGPSVPTEIDLPSHSGMRVDDGNALKPDEDGKLQNTEAMHVTNNLHTPDNVNGWNEGATNRYQKSTNASAPSGYKTAFELDANPTAATNNALTLIKRGSTKNEVLAIQGSPQRQTENAWDYGTSRIYFEGGLVSGWHENPLNPLSVVR